MSQTSPDGPPDRSGTWWPQPYVVRQCSSHRGSGGGVGAHFCRLQRYEKGIVCASCSSIGRLTWARCRGVGTSEAWPPTQGAREAGRWRTNADESVSAGRTGSVCTTRQRRARVLCGCTTHQHIDELLEARVGGQEVVRLGGPLLLEDDLVQVAGGEPIVRVSPAHAARRLSTAP